MKLPVVKMLRDKIKSLKADLRTAEASTEDALWARDVAEKKHEACYAENKQLKEKLAKLKKDANPDDEIWTTAEGWEVYPQQMNNQHLINTINMLQRRAFRKLCIASHPVFASLYREAKKRGLTVNKPS